MRDEVVLLDEAGDAIGSAPKDTVHDDATPLHLAFSCHVVRADGDVLVTRRALSKRTWPGVWTNSFCGHPRPGEAIADAVRRHAEHELGLSLAAVVLELPDFRYRAVDPGGIVENEICPVFTAVAAGPVEPNPAEVMELRWVSPSGLAAAVAAAPWAFSPWLALQAAQLPLLASDRTAA